MKTKFIIDKEINLNESDFLQTKHYADNLTRIIKNTESDKVFTVGLFGSWGSGKSSIIETTSKDFDQTKVKFISYDAWQYANDSFRRMFLRKMRKDLRFEESALMKKFYENESADIANKYELSSTRLYWILGALIVFILITRISPIEIDNKMTIYSTLSIFGLLITIFSGAFHQLKISVTKPLFFAPEQFEDCFKQMISLSLKKYTWIQEKIFVLAGDKSIKNLDKIVIIIDNIDRCNNDLAYSLLTDIKTFLGDEKYSVVFVIPVDDEALRKHLFKVNSLNDDDISVKEKEEFLRKFFNVTIRIKPFQETDMFSFAKNINSKHNLGLSNQTLNLASKEYSTNPRRVIQLFNNLSSELSNYADEFSKKHETLICACLILREEFSSYYKKVINSPILFIQGNQAEEKKEDKSDDKKENRLSRFIRITRNIAFNSDVVVLNKILTNSENMFNGLSADLKDSIDTFDIIKLKEGLNDQSKANEIHDYIFRKLTILEGNQLTDDITSYFDVIAEINNDNKFSVDVLHRYDEIFQPSIGFIIKNTANYDNLCNYAFCLNQLKIPWLKDHIFNNLIQEKNDENYFLKLFNSTLKIFNDKISSKKLSEKYREHYSDINAEIQLSDDQYNYLVNEELTRHILTTENIANHRDRPNLLLALILQNKSNISELIYNDFFAALAEAYNLTIEVSLENYIKYIRIYNSFLNTIPNKIINLYTKGLKDLVDKVIAQISYPAGQFNFVNECISSGSLEDNQEAIKFFINIYRISNNQVDVTEYISQFSPYREVLNIRFKELMDKGYTLSVLYRFIFEDKNYENDLSLELIIYILLNKDKEGYSIPDEATKKTLESFIVSAIESKSTKLFSFVEDIANIPHFEKMITEIISSKDAEFINSLPNSLLIRAVAIFNEENSKEFKENFSFLSVVVELGDQNQTKYIVQFLINNLDSNREITGVLNVAGKIRNIRTTDRDLLISHLNSYMENNKSAIAADTIVLITSIIKHLRAK
jgi:hypothetical protein